jgi:HEAT repeat protein
MFTLLLSLMLAFKAKDATDTALVEALSEVDDGIRIDAVEEIGRRGLLDQQDVVAALARDDPDPHVRRAAMASLEEMSAPNLLEACEYMLVNDVEEKNRGKCMSWIERKGPDSGSEAMVHAAASDPSPKLRRKAIIIIGKRGWVAGAEVVMAATTDPDATVQLEAWRTVIRLGDLEQRAPAHALLADAGGDAKLRKGILKAIGENPLPQDYEVLMALLDDSVDDMAILSARALATLGNSDAAPILREKATTREGKVTEEFNKAASALGG